MQHRRVIRLVERPESWRESAEALIAINLQVENVDDQCVAWFGAFDKKRPGERIIALHERLRVSGFLDGISKTIERVSLQNIPRAQASNWRRGSIDIFHAVNRRVILNNFGLGRRGRSLRECGEWQDQAYSDERDAHGWPPKSKGGSATYSRNRVNPHA